MIPIKNAHLKVAAGTHEGMRGKNNEDLFGVSAYQLSITNPTPALFAIVADGIGGHSAGEVASEIAVEMISQAVAESDSSHPTTIMQAAIIQTSQAIATQAQANNQEKGMGTTCVCAWIVANQLYIAAVGNSRIYLLRNGKLSQINIDHTWVQEAVDAGALTPAQARRHPHANVIRRYLGSRQQVEVDLRLILHANDSDAQALKNQGATLYPGDRLLLCSDGLNDMIEDKLIHEHLAGDDLNQAVINLINSANEAGGKDNTTVVILEMPGGAKKKFSLSQLFENKIKSGAVLLGIGGILLGMTIIAALSYLGWNAFFNKPTVTPTSTPPPAATEMLPPLATEMLPPLATEMLPPLATLPPPASLLPAASLTPAKAVTQVTLPPLLLTNIPLLTATPSSELGDPTATYTAVPLYTYTPVPTESLPSETPTP